MKKKYRLKEKWGVLLFYLSIAAMTLIYSASIR